MSQPHVSASQITQFRACQTRWYIQSVQGRKSPPSLGPLKGSAVHALAEYRQNNGHWPIDPGPVVLPFWPEIVALAPTLDFAVFVQHALAMAQALMQKAHTVFGKFPSDTEAEAVIEVDDFALPLVGRADLILPGIAVIDWKTTKHFKYIKKPEQLLSDPQVIAYVLALSAQPTLKPLPFHHFYVCTEGAIDVRHTLTELTPSQLKLGKNQLEADVAQMAELRSIPLENVPKNTAACDTFGGCPWRSECFPPPAGISGGSMSSAFAARRASLGLAPLEPATPFVQSINPPEGAGHAVVPAPVNAVVVPDRVLVAVPPPEPAPVPAPIEVIESVAGEAAAVLDSVVKRGSTGPKARAKTTKPTEPAETGQEATQPTPALTHSERPAVRILCIGCMPIKGGPVFTLGEEWLAPLAAQAARTIGCAVWSLADYGKGKAVVQGLVAAAMAAGEVPDYLVLDRRNALAEAVVEQLVPYFNLVLCKVG